MAFHPEGDVLASGSWDHTVRLWDVATGEHIWQLIAHSSVVNSVAFHPTENMLASGSWDHRIRLWPLAPQDVQPLSNASPEQRWQQRLDAACQIANRNLTPDEWALIFGDGIAYHETCPDATTPNPL